MKFEEAKKIALAKGFEVLYLKAKVINKLQTYVCPLCNNGRGENGDGLYPDINKPHCYKCFKCDAYGDIFNFVAMEYNLNILDSFNKVFELLDIKCYITKPYKAEISSVENDLAFLDIIFNKSKVDASRCKIIENNDIIKYSLIDCLNIYNINMLKVDAFSDVSKKRLISLVERKNLKHKVIFKKDKMNPSRCEFKEIIDKGKENLLGNLFALEFLRKRGFTDETIHTFNLGYQDNKIIIPYGDINNYYITRDIEKKEYRKPKGNVKEPIFNISSLYTNNSDNKINEYLFVVESPFCAISIIQAGGEAISLGGTGYFKLIKILKVKKSPKTLILSLDNDEAGKLVTSKLASELAILKQDFKIFNLSKNFKDPNEFLQKEKENFNFCVLNINELLNNKNEILKYSAFNYLDEFFNDLESPEKSFIPTEFKYLDNILDGGMYEGLYILGAISSLGKTTFSLNLADNIAACGKDVLFFSFEMSKKELIAKSISREIFKIIQSNNIDLKFAKSARDILSKEKFQKYNDLEKKIISEAVTNYSAYSKNIYFYDFVDDTSVLDIKKIIDNHILVTNNIPVIFINLFKNTRDFDELNNKISKRI